MRFSLTLKTPDALEAAIRQQILMDIEDGQRQNMDDEDIESIVHREMEKCKKWIRFGELLTIDIDTDAMICDVRTILN